MQHDLMIGDLDIPVDPAGTLEVSRVSPDVIKAIIKAATDVIVSAINHLPSM